QSPVNAVLVLLAAWQSGRQVDAHRLPGATPFRQRRFTGMPSLHSPPCVTRPAIASWRSRVCKAGKCEDVVGGGSVRGHPSDDFGTGVLAVDDASAEDPTRVSRLRSTSIPHGHAIHSCASRHSALTGFISASSWTSDQSVLSTILSCSGRHDQSTPFG